MLFVCLLVFLLTSNPVSGVSLKRGWKSFLGKEETRLAAQGDRGLRADDPLSNLDLDNMVLCTYFEKAGKGTCDPTLAAGACDFCKTRNIGKLLGAAAIQETCPGLESMKRVGWEWQMTPKKYMDSDGENWRICMVVAIEEAEVAEALAAAAAAAPTKATATGLSATSLSGKSGAAPVAGNVAGGSPGASGLSDASDSITGALSGPLTKKVADEPGSVFSDVAKASSGLALGSGNYKTMWIVFGVGAGAVALITVLFVSRSSKNNS